MTMYFAGRNQDFCVLLSRKMMERDMSTVAIVLFTDYDFSFWQRHVSSI